MSDQSATERLVHKVTLSSGKVVILDDITVKADDMAMDVSSKRHKDNMAMMVMDSAKELLKLLIIEIDGKKLTGIEKESMDSMFDYSEFSQLRNFVLQLKGAENPMPQVESVNYGAK